MAGFVGVWQSETAWGVVGYLDMTRQNNAPETKTSRRVTPKGTHPKNYAPKQTSHTDFKSRPKSSVWVTVLVFSLLGSGVATIIINYINVLWETSNVVLLVGLGLVLAGLIAATRLC